MSENSIDDWNKPILIPCEKSISFNEHLQPTETEEQIEKKKKRLEKRSKQENKKMDEMFNEIMGLYNILNNLYATIDPLTDEKMQQVRSNIDKDYTKFEKRMKRKYEQLEKERKENTVEEIRKKLKKE